MIIKFLLELLLILFALNLIMHINIKDKNFFILELVLLAKKIFILQFDKIQIVFII